MPYSGLLDQPLVCDDLDTPTLPYAPSASLYDGTTDFKFRGEVLTGIADDKEGLLNLWFRVDAAASQGQRIIDFWNPASGGRNVLQLLFIPFQGGILQLSVLSSTGLGILNSVRTVTTFNAPAEYANLLMSWNAATATVQLYVDDVSDLASGSNVGNFAAGYGGADELAIGSDRTGALKYEGALADVYFTTEFLDLTVTANRRKFIDDAGNPVFLGDTGELPTGTAALIYLRGNQADQGINSGTGGDFVSQATQVPGETPGPVVIEDADPFPTPHSWNGL